MNTTFDHKETLMLEHYRRVLESRSFDEYDVLGFLIFIRRHIDEKKYPTITEFANLIAHRERDRGIVVKCIRRAIENDYETRKHSKSLKGYNGPTIKTWAREWTAFGKQYNIVMPGQAIDEIVLCIFSLTQGTSYTIDELTRGRIELFQSKDGALALVTTEGKPNSPYVCFSKTNPYAFLKEFNAGLISEPVETERVEGKLRLKCEGEYII